MTCWWCSWNCSGRFNPRPNIWHQPKGNFGFNWAIRFEPCINSGIWVINTSCVFQIKHYKRQVKQDYKMSFVFERISMQHIKYKHLYQKEKNAEIILTLNFGNIILQCIKKGNLRFLLKHKFQKRRPEYFIALSICFLNIYFSTPFFLLSFPL